MNYTPMTWCERLGFELLRATACRPPSCTASNSWLLFSLSISWMQRKEKRIENVWFINNIKC